MAVVVQGSREMENVGVLTPWGDSRRLRRRRLPPGPQRGGEAATKEHQRRRLFAAMVASVAQRGYEKTRIGAVAHQAGVGQRSASELFPPSPKPECFLTAVDRLYAGGAWLVRAAYEEEGEWEERLRAGLTALLELIVEQPAAAHAGIVGIYEVGERGSARVERGLTPFEGLLRESFAGCPDRSALPEEVIAAVVGAVHMLIHDRLREGREGELPGMAADILDWVLSYEAPAHELRGSAATALPAVERSGAPAERLMLAMAEAVSEHGYAATTVRELAAAAQTSHATLYEHFGGKQELFLAAFDLLTSTALEVSEEAFASRDEWPEAMRAVNRALFDYLASEPLLTRLALVEVMGAGREALTARDLMLRPFGSRLMHGGYQVRPGAPKVAAEACALAVYAAAGRWIKHEGAESLPAMVPLATFLEMAPFLGSRPAAALAAEDAAARGTIST